MPKHITMLIILAVFISLFSFYMPIYANQPTGYDLAAAVNAYRQANGYYTLNPHSQVMAAAQAHAEWIVQTGQGGHIGTGGSDETMRVSWTGYGAGAEIRCDENWGGGSSIEEVMSGAWSDWVHQEVMLNAWGNRYTDIGGGVAPRGDGHYVFVLDVCLVVGQEASGEVPQSTAITTPVAVNLQSPSASNFINPVTRATPQADGSITHKVLYGQTLIAIAEAYGVSLDTLRSLNNLAADATIIWEGDELLIQPATGAAQGQASKTLEILPSPTINTISSGKTPPPPSTPTTAAKRPTLTPPLAAQSNLPAAKWGIWLLVISGGTMVIMVLFASTHKNKGK